MEYMGPSMLRDDKLKKFNPSWDAVSSGPKTDTERQKLLQRLIRYAFTGGHDLLDTHDNDRLGQWFRSMRAQVEGHG
jgi:hypothetical protein